MKNNETKRITLDANEAVARVAYRMSELISIYPITPSTSMAELCDEWAAADKPNLWGEVPKVMQMQSEGGAAGTLHGTAMGGALSTTFTASQGLLLMIPILYKLAGELTPSVFHVSARAIATNSLSIFGDHSDVMACRQTGVAQLVSNSVQEAQDMAAIAHAASLATRLPFMHFFDGFRTSHEYNSLDTLPDQVIDSLIDPESLAAFYDRALSPDKPSVRGTAQNPDTYFQTREAVNSFVKKTPAIVQALMEKFALLTGREYKLFEYYGHPEAEQVIVMMGSGVETAAQTAEYLNANSGSKYGVVAVRLYRPFFTHAFMHGALPQSVKSIAVLDRTKEPGSIGEPLYLDVSLACRKASRCPNQCRSIDPLVVGGRYGLGSKEFTPAMAKAVFENLLQERPKDHFTIGIRDDVTEQSLDFDPSFTLEDKGTKSAMFYGLGSDGTVGANKNTIKIIGEATTLNTQAYFVYDSKKSGGLTTSHLRFGEKPIQAPYLIDEADFIGCHQPQFLGRVDMLSQLKSGGTFLINTPCAASDIWGRLPHEVQAALIAKEAKLYVIDAYKVAAEVGMGRRINTIMQVAFFALSDVIPTDEAIRRIKGAIEKTYGRKGPKIVEMNCAAVDAALAYLQAVEIPAETTARPEAVKWVPDEAPDFVQRVTARLLAGQGDLLPVSAFPVDGTWPSGTSQYEKRKIATEIPVWNSATCTQCNKCAMFCPHAAIRPAVYDKSALAMAPDGFPHADYKGTDGPGKAYTLQVFPEDCTGCNACVELCPARDAEGKRAIEMTPIDALLEKEKEKLAFFQSLPTHEIDDAKLTAKNLPLRKPLFEFSGACSGCTQTPYVRSLTQLFGDRLLVANATGCSSIYGGNLPTTPYCTNSSGQGPAWANSLFEDNAEFGLGLYLSAKHRTESARRLLLKCSELIGSDTIDAILDSSDSTRAQTRELITELKTKLASATEAPAKRLLQQIDYLVPKSTWIVGGDGWAYDIGFGGLDHVLASGENINVLVLDTEVYSNTGGQSSKSTPTGAIAKFAAAGKTQPKKDLAQIAMSYGGIYVAQIALGANEQQAIEVIREAEAYEGPSLILAYGPCLAHGIDMALGPERQKAAVDSGYWPIYRYDPRKTEQGLPAFRLDSFEPSVPVAEFMRKENRFRSLERSSPERAAELFAAAQQQVDSRWSRLEKLAAAQLEDDDDDDDGWG
ncbi:pyruvate:ferredoxin (flavodoxin) oxidoreductase [Coraliomargarita algicola]|uniref:Pyruvate:ferredoxin (Flavodoxin) oxidoreductase n=1 Tax=Coraliomargarita algicola TaxID=3092156 RepID=A0ABZ0RQB4_9BACT|nr:pyruvate:ferredoxin (flavodoxin) oxidoreductase [Coraliomargarita sp. J2-16]WPJ97606.1 pyruvate:ferredoxin (flavodoxin) oxidoreductase [Coraliomargarita sp. J2-16]